MGQMELPRVRRKRLLILVSKIMYVYIANDNSRRAQRGLLVSLFLPQERAAAVAGESNSRLSMAVNNLSVPIPPSEGRMEWTGVVKQSQDVCVYEDSSICM